MSCNSCKSGQNIPDQNIENNKSIGKYIVNFILFLFTCVILPLIFPLIIIMLFKTIVLNNNINLLPSLVQIGKNLKGKEIEEDDNEEIKPEELELVGVDEIKTIIPKTIQEDQTFYHI